MYCDKCGVPLSAGAQYCSGCGRAVAPGTIPPAVASGAVGAQGRGSWAIGRVRRHVHRLATLWLANGVLRLLAVSGFLLFGRMFWPGTHWMGPRMWWFDSIWPGGLFSVGIFLGFFGLLHLVLAWGLFERQPWARTLGLVLGIFALVRIPFGTALGIYTLWVLGPEHSAREWEQMTHDNHQYGPERVPASR